MLELLQYEYFVNALWGCLFAGILGGIAGSYIVARRMVFMAGGITHAAFGGLGLGHYLGFNPGLTSSAWSVGVALLIEYLSRRGRERMDTLIGAVWALGMSAGIILIKITPGYAPRLDGFLFGNILLITREDLFGAGAVCVLAIGILLLFYKELLAVAFDEEFARSRRLPALLITSFMTALTAITIIAMIKITGLILIMAMLTLPQATANVFTRDLKWMMILSAVIGSLTSAAGIFIATFWNLPAGAVIVVLSGALYLLFRGLSNLLAIRKRHGSVVENN